ncbi:hypothetical protein [Rhizobium sp. BR 315]|uniref:hypothetical protein n=1 Tax=Rhizobium sp. BR 315 TaxID=3040014 RepID=UPI003D34D3C7
MSFIAEAAAAANIDDYKLLLIDCDEEIWAQRLMIGRSQPELANADMMSWAAYLRSEATRHG